jgi:protein lifeguard
MIGSFASLFTLFWKAQSYPWNLVILGVFTLFEATLVGSIVAYVS